MYVKCGFRAEGSIGTAPGDFSTANQISAVEPDWPLKAGLPARCWPNRPPGLLTARVERLEEVARQVSEDAN